MSDMSVSNTGAMLDVDMVYYINLDRRIDRNIHMSNQFKQAGISMNQVVRFPAIDGTRYCFTNDELYMFKKVDYKNNSFANKIMANQLSHYNIFIDMLKNNYNKVLILQDDVMFRDNFIEHFNNVSKSLPDDSELVNIGCHEYACGKNFIAFNLQRDDDYIKIEKRQINNYISEWNYKINPCSLSYIVTKHGAENMIQHFKTTGFLRATDINFNNYLHNKGIFYGSRTVLCTGDPSLGTDIFNV